MKTSAEERKAISLDEGIRTKAYLDTGGVPTIGVGHTKGVKMGMVATLDQIDKWLEEDLADAEADVERLVKVPLNQNMFDALVSFVFNLGGTQLAGSTLLKLLNQGLYKDAADQFPRWNKDNGVVLNGLVKRRARERATFLRPV